MFFFSCSFSSSLPHCSLYRPFFPRPPLFLLPSSQETETLKAALQAAVKEDTETRDILTERLKEEIEQKIIAHDEVRK